MSWINSIFCPFCSGNLKVVENIASNDSHGFTGILECNCRLHPVTHNILNFGGKSGYGLDATISYLKKGNIRKATLVQIETEALDQGLLSKIVKKIFNYGIIQKKRIGLWRLLIAPNLLKVSTFTKGVRKLNLGGFGDYLIHRYALPSFHSALPVCFLLKAFHFRSILDIGCGAGHYTYLLKQLFPDSIYFGLDQYYANLLLGARFLNPANGIFICQNLKQKTPFKKKFDLVFSSDTFSTLSIDDIFFKNYLNLVEVKGLTYLPRFDHSWGKSLRHGLEETYKMNNSMACYAFSEEFIIETLNKENRINLSEILKNQDLSNSRAFGLILGNPENILNLESDHFVENLSRTIGPWSLDPCYHQTPDNKKEIYHMDINFAMPHQEERKNTILKYMPDELELDHGSFEGRHIRQDTELLPQLIRNYCVQVSPPDY